jgi:outer membrane biosynthesis protein TonB
MERAEKIGLGVAGAGHVLLFAALSTSWLSADPLKLRNRPIEVTIADDVALQSAARRLADTPPPPAQGEEEGAPERTLQQTVEKLSPPDPTAAKPVPVPTPVPTAKPEPRKTDRPRPDSKAAQAPDTGRQAKSRGSKLKLDLSGIGATESSGAPAAKMSAREAAALNDEISRQIYRHLRLPSGADVERLVAVLEVKLDRTGAVIGRPAVLDVTGVTPSNQPQVSLYKERAVQAIMLASPFTNLPPQYYEQWRWISPLRIYARKAQ